MFSTIFKIDYDFTYTPLDYKFPLYKPIRSRVEFHEPIKVRDFLTFCFKRIAANQLIKYYIDDGTLKKSGKYKIVAQRNRSKLEIDLFHLD